MRLREGVVDMPVRSLCSFVRRLSGSLGILLPQSYRNNRIALIRDGGRDYKHHSTRGHDTSAALPFHSDRCDVTVLLYVRAASEGGRVSVVSYGDAAARLAQVDAGLYSILLEAFPFDLREERLYEEPRWLMRPVLWHSPNGLRGHYIRRFIVDSRRHLDCPKLSCRQIDALDAFDSVLASLARGSTFAPQAGDVFVVDNYRVAHAREAFVDDPDRDGRLAIRAWLAPFHSETLPHVLLPMVGATQGGCVRGGIGRSKRFHAMLGRRLKIPEGTKQ
jgi:hypothetical protein